ncbi:MAG: ClpXP protease specificity-enhancing factor [Gammaproteobacteria bacterium]|nr:ClpXP protease specificity-enhancing factor [Gammaproteobacteria bacterium]
MRSQRPYLLRALYEWIVDSGCTPHLLVDADWPGLIVPPSAVSDGRVVLNVAPEAVRDFLIGDVEIEVQCRFAGVPHAVVIPVDGVLAIYARENGAGMAFEAAETPADEAGPEAGASTDPDGDDEPPPRGGGHLRVVK